jgi:SAM-dependent methyltransferase
MAKRQFDFGRNWQAFSENALTSAQVQQARTDFRELFCGVPLSGCSFIDVGFGQGLSLLLATSSGARCVGCDINGLCEDVLRRNQRRFFPELAERDIPVVIGSILDDTIVESLRAKSSDPANGLYEIVHAWGVLHHTGDMMRAIRNAASLVAPKGHLIIAIYNRHWSSGAWRFIKRFYNSASPVIQRLLRAIFYPVIYGAKWFVTGSNPSKKTRGMDFYYDVVDWIGGYPYEYATANEITALLELLNFQLERMIPATVPTGCNQFVFRAKNASSGH